MNTERIGSWLQTYSGVAYYPLDPRPEEVNITDIAHSLSQICRYAGHCKRFYSVAEHSVKVSFMVPERFRLQALLHDATEAYCQDIPRPLKKHLTNYRDIEQMNWLAICDKFGVSYQEAPEVKQADNDILLEEYRVLFGGKSHLPWVVEGAVDRGMWKSFGSEPSTAFAFFMARYNDLIEDRFIAWF